MSRPRRPTPAQPNKHVVQTRLWWPKSPPLCPVGSRGSGPRACVYKCVLAPLALPKLLHLTPVASWCWYKHCVHSCARAAMPKLPPLCRSGSRGSGSHPHTHATNFCTSFLHIARKLSKHCVDLLRRLRSHLVYARSRRARWTERFTQRAMYMLMFAPLLSFI